jgi:hypothetical protein
VRHTLTREEANEFFVQDNIAAAPCVVWIVGVPPAHLPQVDTTSYRRLLIRAGAAGQRIWTAFIAAGREGTLIAGIVPGAAKRMLPLDVSRELNLLAFIGG